MKKKKRRRKSSALPTRDRLNGRLFFIGVFICIIMALLGCKVGYLTLFKHEDYAKAALANMLQSEVSVEAARGTIQDRSGRQLAVSLIAYDVILSPYQIMNKVKEEKRSEIYAKLEAATGISAHEISSTVNQKLADNPNSQWYQLAQRIDLEDEQVQALNALGGVTVKKTYKRNYPNGELAAHVLGFYNNEIGQFGVEQGYEEYLVGQPGRAYTQVQESKIIIDEYQEPKTGATVKLTLDQVVQQCVEDTMNKYVRQFGPSKASCIIMQPNTGEILAMYSYPSFNPNTYNDLSEQVGSNVWSQMKSEEKSSALNTAWKNYSVQMNYEPGSTFKPLVVAMALQEGVIDVSDTYMCTGAKTVADRRIPCWKAGGHGHQTLSDALANSCNVAMMDIVEKIDSEVFLKYFADYGFGEKTGVNLAGEEGGVLHKSLSSVDKATSSMGQSFMVTPIQLITAFSSVINGGYLMEPYVVSEITNEEGEVLYSHGYVNKRTVLSSNIANSVRDALKQVVDEGTGMEANVSGYSIGGKTGTGQKFIEGTSKRVEDRYAISFMGFAPVDNPQVVALIVFDDLPEHTGAATGAFKDIMTEILPYLEIETNDDAIIEGEETVSIPEVTGKTLYEAVNSLSALGLDYDVLGSGVKVNEQYPSSGSSWSKDGVVTLYTTTDSPKDLVEVPDLVGKTVQEAQTLVNGQLKLEGSTSGIINFQIPKAGCKIEKNNKIIIKTTE